ncbi:hypothetical protein GGF39_002570 [Coemansia sp. RSA 1721]|nr:hypothetical protein GGF39_002570 [Coemansia sp. RSA 1721]
MSFANKRPGGRILPARRLTPQVDPEKQFEKIEQAINEIYNHNSSQLSFEELYRTAYGLVLSKNGPMLYGGVKQVLETHLKECMHRDILKHIQASGSRRSVVHCEALLSSVRSLWSEHVTAMLMIKDVLMYVDKVYVKTAQVPSIYEMGMCVFRDQILLAADRQLNSEVIDAAMFLISQERKSASEVNRGALHGVVSMMIELQDPGQLRPVYDVYFEPRLFAETSEHYREMAQIRISKMGAPEYGRAAQTDLEAESLRTKEYLAASSFAGLHRIALERLISTYAQEILTIPGSGLVQMLDQRDIPSLKVIYKLYESSPPDVLNVLKRGICDHILSLGKKVQASATTSTDVSASKPTSEVSGIAGKTVIALRWVQEILALYDVFDEILIKALADNQKMRYDIKDAFIEIINANRRAPELLSLFIDDNLKNGLRRKTEHEIDHTLEQSVLMFRFLKDKDAFEHYYKLHLAKRLLFGRSISDDAEQSLVSKLKVECGSHFTLKLEGMFKDMQLSSDINRQLRESGTFSDIGFDMNVSVLTPTFWPTMAPSGASSDGEKGALSKDDASSGGIIIPSTAGVSKSIETFSAHYLKYHSGRRLTWQYAMGNADLKVRFGSRTHELNVSTYQMLILLLFVDEDEAEEEQGNGSSNGLTTAQIQEKTHIPKESLARHLQSLACGKYKVLTKHPMSRDINPDDVFRFNNGFKSPQYRIRLPVASARNSVETEKEKEASQAAIGRERQYLIEAAVVRIMKTRRQMSHEQLVGEAVEQLSSRFMASPKMIKNGIEKLIDREYLQRSPDDPRLYIYLA